VSGQEVTVAAVKPNKQSSKLIHPGKGTFCRKASLIHNLIEHAFWSWFCLLAIAFVFWNVWQELVIETNLASLLGVKGTIGIEIRTLDRQALYFDPFESGLEMRFQIEGIVMITSYNPCRSQHIAVFIENRQNIAGFSLLATLISNRFASFLGDRM